MAVLVAISGLAGSGKDTLAGELAAVLDEDEITVKLAGLADPLREIAAEMGLGVYCRDKKEVEVSLRYGHFEVSLATAMTNVLGDVVGEEDLADLFASFATILRNTGYVSSNRQDVLTISPRRFCQLLGTEGGRAIRDTFWISVFKARVSRLGTQPCSWPTAGQPAPDVVIATDIRFPNELVPFDYHIHISWAGTAAVENHVSESFSDKLRTAANTQVSNGYKVNLTEVADGIVPEIKELI